jgi:SET and MYND domain-containing protein 4
MLIDYENKYENSVRDETSLTEMLHAEAEYKSDSYLTIFNLITNSAVRKLNDLFRRSFVAFFLVKFLIKINFFEAESSTSTTTTTISPKKSIEHACFIGGLLLRHLQSISCNAHEISILKIEQEGLKAMATSYANGIGAGIYAILSLFNHSCDPHVVRYFRGSKCQVRAIRGIKKDEEIYDNYGVVYAVNSVEERREKLIDQYFFHCICEPCVKDWPRYAKIPNDLNVSNFKCVECMTKSNKVKVGECPKCEIELDNLRLEQLAANQCLKTLLAFNRATNLEDQKIKNKIHDMFEAFCKYMQKLESYKIKRPFQDYNSYEEALKQCLNFIHMR